MLVMCVDGRQVGQTALMIAAEHGHAAVCEALIKAGADMTAQDKVASSSSSVSLVPAACGLSCSASRFDLDDVSLTISAASL